MKALAAFAATKHIAVSIRRRAACLVAARPRLGANISFCAANALRQFRLIAGMHGDVPFEALKFYKTCGAIKF